MGTGLIDFYNNRVKKEWKFAFFSVFVVGLLVHAFRFTNVILNHDALFNTYSSQNMLGSGRWFLSVSCAPSTYFDLPWVIGIFSLLYIGLTAVIVVDVLKIKNSFLSMLVGALLVTFPSVANIFYYSFTADGYMMAMLFAAISVKLCPIGEKRIWKFLLSSVFICLSCAIYQAYISFAMLLAITYFVSTVLEGDKTDKECVVWVGKQFVTYAGGLVLYYAIWKICLWAQNTLVTTYLGMDKLEDTSRYDFASSIEQAFSRFTEFFVDLEMGWTVINVLLIVTFFVVFGIAVAKSGVLKRKLQFALAVAALLVVPFAAYAWVFAAVDTTWPMRMEQCMSLLYIFVAVLAERWTKPKLSNVVAVVLIAFVINNSLTANKFYYFTQKAYKQTYATAVEMSSRIHELDDGEVQLIAIGGAIPAWTEDEYEDMDSLGSLGKLKLIRKNLFLSQKHTCLFLHNEVGFELSYYTNNPENAVPVYKKSPVDPVPKGWEFEFPMVSQNDLNSIKKTEQYMSMPCWPDKGSVAVLDVDKLTEQDPDLSHLPKTVVVKLSNKP